MVWDFIRRNRRKIYVLTLIAGGSYAAFRFFNDKLSRMINEQDKMVEDWKKQLYYEHNRDTSLKTSSEIFAQVVLNINRAFECDSILAKLSSTNDSNEKRQLWEELRIECFARLFTFTYSSSFVLALTELVVSVLSGRLYAQSHLQHSQINNQITTNAGGISATTKSSHAESVQEHNSLISRDIRLACLDVIRYTTETGMNCLIEDVRKAARLVLSRIPLQQTLDINDVIWYCTEIRHQIEKMRFQNRENFFHPILKYVRSASIPRRATTSQAMPPPPTTTMSTTVSINSFSYLQEARPTPPPVFNLQRQFEMECVDMIESEGFQRVLLQIIDQSFSNIYDEFAREMSKTQMKTSATLDSDSSNSSILHDPKLPFAKIIPISNNIYSRLSNTHHGMMLHLQSLACQPELHEYTKYAYDMFSNESDKSPSRTAYSLLPTISPSLLQSNLSSFFPWFTR